MDYRPKCKNYKLKLPEENVGRNLPKLKVGQGIF
jgi:hypothetical protein